MALSASNVWDVRIGGSDTANGGAFDPVNANMATDLAATVATGASPLVTSASYTFIARDVNAWLFIKSGTNWTAGWYQIASVSGGTATLSAAAGAGYLAPPTTDNAQSCGVTTAAGCATTASPTSGTWSVDYSQGTTAGITYTDMVIDGTTNTKYTSAGNPVGPNIVGNVMAVTSGTGFTVQWVQVSSVSGTTATCDKSLGTLSSTGGHGGLGGCLATPGKASGLMVNGSGGLFIKANGGSPDYTCSASNNVAGGRCTPSSNSTLHPNVVSGWNTVRTITNTDATRPTFAPTANSVTLFDSAGATLFRQLSFTTPGHTSCHAIAADNGWTYVERCKWDGYASTFNVQFGGSVYWLCEAKNSTAGAIGTARTVIGCTVNAGGNDDTAITANVTTDSIVYGWKGSGITPQALLVNGFGGLVNRCVVYGGTGTNGNGFGVASSYSGHMINCVAYGCSQVGFNLDNGSVAFAATLLNCASGGNGTNWLAVGTKDLTVWNPSCVTLTADPFTSAGGLNFSTNTTAGGGALLQGLGFPASWPGFSTSSYIDIGAAQHGAAASGPTYFAR